MRLILSTDAVATPSPAVLHELREKHPECPPPPTSAPLAPPAAAAPPITAAEVFSAVHTFPRGSAAGPDGLRPQRLLDMVGHKFDDHCLNAWFLDDGTVGGKPATVAHVFGEIIRKAREIGLVVNEAKCELHISGGTEQAQNDAVAFFQELYPKLRILTNTDFLLLGAPVLVEGIGPAVAEKCATVKMACDRLELLPRHHALFLLKNCLGAPKIIYMLRCCNAWKQPQQLYQLDEAMRLCFQTLCNVRTSHDDYPCWRQATLPVSRGGIGIRRAEELALPAFLASIHSVTDLISLLLPDHPAVNISAAFELWKTNARLAELPEHNARKAQRTWDLPLCNASLSVLLDIFRDDEINRARLLAQSTPEAGIWLNALPSAHIGNLLDDDTVKISVGLRLGVSICEAHSCSKCHKPVDVYGHHGLSCAFSAGRHPRHGGLNSILCRSLVSAGIPAKLEPRGTSHTSDRRPDGCTTFAWQRGMCLAWDVTCVDTVAMSHRKATSVTAGSAAQAEDRKRDSFRLANQE
ncbi:uncharacterized protein LOC129601387 [Paramacrobiotus metropolitanus]|uniref:uncharacterized protein LOC129601387 n=1 Tax=Paramacrobiotus metropolitanus TaxID=2943436 RepID=UPI002445E6B0|nr:uncharacterized protein LOC129601387 [Paramacrobiotus metropolitanus]